MRRPTYFTVTNKQSGKLTTGKIEESVLIGMDQSILIEMDQSGLNGMDQSVLIGMDQSVLIGAALDAMSHLTFIGLNRHDDNNPNDAICRVCNVLIQGLRLYLNFKLPFESVCRI